MCHYKRGQQKQNKQEKQTKKQKQSKPLIVVLEEVFKISGIIFESRQRRGSV